MPGPPVHSNLSQLDIKGAFVTAQQGEGDKDKVDVAEFLNILALCGHIKYEEIDSMTLAQRVAGVRRARVPRREAADVPGERAEAAGASHNHVDASTNVVAGLDLYFL